MLGIVIAFIARTRLYPDDADIVRACAYHLTTCRGSPAIRKADTTLAGMSHKQVLARVALACERLGLVPGYGPAGHVRLPTSVTAAGRPARAAYFYAAPFTVRP
jgi:hypothetical protein